MSTLYRHHKTVFIFSALWLNGNKSFKKEEALNSSATKCWDEGFVCVCVCEIVNTFINEKKIKNKKNILKMV